MFEGGRGSEVGGGRYIIPINKYIENLGCPYFELGVYRDRALVNIGSVQFLYGNIPAPPQRTVGVRYHQTGVV